MERFKVPRAPCVYKHRYKDRQTQLDVYKDR